MGHEGYLGGFDDFDWVEDSGTEALDKFVDEHPLDSDEVPSIDAGSHAEYVITNHPPLSSYDYPVSGERNCTHIPNSLPQSRPLDS
jgi:hypothetical protein